LKKSARSSASPVSVCRQLAEHRAEKLRRALLDDKEKPIEHLMPMHAAFHIRRLERRPKTDYPSDGRDPKGSRLFLSEVSVEHLPHRVNLRGDHHACPGR
jgi:hypothetical protein